MLSVMRERVSCAHVSFLQISIPQISVPKASVTAGEAVLRIMTLAGALAFGGAGPVMGATCNADTAGLGDVATLMAAEGLMFRIEDCDVAPGLADVVAQDAAAVQSWVKTSPPDQTKALKLAPEPTDNAFEETISKPIIWNEWTIETPGRVQPVGFGLLHPGAKPALMHNRAQNLELRLYMPY